MFILSVQSSLMTIYSFLKFSRSSWDAPVGNKKNQRVFAFRLCLWPREFHGFQRSFYVCDGRAIGSKSLKYTIVTSKGPFDTAKKKEFSSYPSTSLSTRGSFNHSPATTFKLFCHLWTNPEFKKKRDLQSLITHFCRYCSFSPSQQKNGKNDRKKRKRSAENENFPSFSLWRFEKRIQGKLFLLV